jgi:glucose-6-phosphate dehydrogenase assembly protein OpcA
MIVDGEGREVLGGGGVLPVDVRSISDELRRLWESAGAEGTAVTRACARNLVALCTAGAGEDAARPALLAVATAHPARAFLVVATPGPPERFEASLEAHCVVQPGRRHVCCEQISLAVGDAARRRAASAIVPLLVPDLPVFVWITGALDFADPALERLLDVADRLVFDSRACPDPARTVVELVHAEREDRWSPADLEWARLEPWREAVAALFDDPACRALAAHVERIEIEHGSDTVVAGALLAGWIVDRVEAARAAEAPGERERGEAGDAAGEPGAPAVLLTPVAGPGVRRVALATRHPEARLEVALAEEGRAFALSIAAPGACALPTRRSHDPAALPDLLGRLVAAAVPDELYERALLRAASWLGGTAPD